MAVLSTTAAMLIGISGACTSGGDMTAVPTTDGLASLQRFDGEDTLVEESDGENGTSEHNDGAVDGDEAGEATPSWATNIVTGVLDRYDNTVTAMAADPSGALDPTSRIRRTWDTVVAPGSLLHDDVVDRMVHEPLAEDTRLLPGPDGVGYRHHVIDVIATEESHIRFTWCGYAPGVRVMASSGVVVDDQVAVMSGTGRVTVVTDPLGQSSPDVAAGWVLDELDHLEFDVMPAGTTDPCT